MNGISAQNKCLRDAFEKRLIVWTVRSEGQRLPFSAGDSHGVSDCCCGVCSCGCAPDLDPSRMSVTDLCDRRHYCDGHDPCPCRACASWRMTMRVQRKCGPCLAPSRAPSPLCQASGIASGTVVNASSCLVFLLRLHCVGLAAWDRCCRDDWALV